MSETNCRICGDENARIVFTPGPREVEQIALCDDHRTMYATGRLRVDDERGEA